MHQHRVDRVSVLFPVGVLRHLVRLEQVVVHVGELLVANLAKLFAQVAIVVFEKFLLAQAFRRGRVVGRRNAIPAPWMDAVDCCFAIPAPRMAVDRCFAFQAPRMAGVDHCFAIPAPRIDRW